MKTLLACWQRILPRNCLAAAGLSLLVAAGCTSVQTQGTSQEPLANYDQIKPEARAGLALAKGRAFEQSGELDQALAAYRETLELDPNSAEANRRMAIVYDKQGHFDRSPEYYQKALELTPGKPETYCDVGYSMYLQKRYKDAEMNLRQALALQYDQPRAHNNLAMVLAHTGRIKEAMAEFNNAGVAPAEAYTNIAFAMTVQHNFAEAAKYYKLALAANPGSREAQQGKYELEQLVAKYDRMQKVMIESLPGDTTAPSSDASRQVAHRPTGLRQDVAPRKSVQPQRQVVAQQPEAPSQPQRQVAASQPKTQPQQAEQPPVQQVQRVEPLPQVQRQVVAETQQTGGRSLKLSFSPGALRRDRYLEEQTDPALQQVAYEEESESN